MDSTKGCRGVVVVCSLWLPKYLDHKNMQFTHAHTHTHARTHTHLMVAFCVDEGDVGEDGGDQAAPGVPLGLQGEGWGGGGRGRGNEETQGVRGARIA